MRHPLPSRRLSCGPERPRACPSVASRLRRRSGAGPGAAGSLSAGPTPPPSARQAPLAEGPAPRLRLADGVLPCSLADGPVVPPTPGCFGAWLRGCRGIWVQASESLPVSSQPSWRRSCGRRWRRTSRWSRYRDERRSVHVRRCAPAPAPASCPSAPRPQQSQAEPRVDTPWKCSCQSQSCLAFTRFGSPDGSRGTRLLCPKSGSLSGPGCAGVTGLCPHAGRCVGCGRRPAWGASGRRRAHAAGRPGTACPCPFAATQPLLGEGVAFQAVTAAAPFRGRLAGASDPHDLSLSQGCLCGAGVGAGAPTPPLGTGSGGSFPRAPGAEPGHPAGLGAVSVAPPVCSGLGAGTWRVTARLCGVLTEDSSLGRWSLFWARGAVGLVGSSGPSLQQPWRV